MSETCHTRIGRYKVLAELGHGPMGIVYRARGPHLGRTVAIKTVRPDLALPAEQYGEIKRRFYEEAKAASRLSHPNIVAVYDVLEVDETPYIVMEYVEGQSLAQVMDAGVPLPPALAVHMALQVCQALHYAHERHVVHRDIKPSNILLAHGGAVKVGDFGFARIGGMEFTETGAPLGDPSYMSPEQIQQAEVDRRSDLFSLGVVLYEALTGIGPSPGEDQSSCFCRILDPALDAVIRRALAKDAEQRYPTVRDFAEALRQTWQSTEGGGSWCADSRQVLEEAEPAALPAQRETAVLDRLPGAERSRAGLIGAGCLLAAILAGVVIWRWPSEREKRVSAAPPAEEIVAARTPEPADPGTPTGPETAPPPPPAAQMPPPGEASGPRPGGPPGGVSMNSGRPRGGAKRLPASRRLGQSTEPSPPRSSVAPAPPVRDDAQVAALVHVEAARPPAVSGCLSVNAVPFAKVYVDGEYAGETPRGCLRVSAGDRRVVFEADGRRSPERILHVTENHTTENPLSLSYDFTANRYLDR